MFLDTADTEFQEPTRTITTHSQSAHTPHLIQPLILSQALKALKPVNGKIRLDWTKAKRISIYRSIAKNQRRTAISHDIDLIN